MRCSLRQFPLCLAVMLLLSACGQDTEQSGPRYLGVDVLIAEPSDNYRVERLFVGRVEAAQRADIGFEFPGKVAAIRVNDGDPVRQGEVLAEMDRQFLDVAGRQLEAQLKQARADLELVESSLKRQQTLRQKGFAAEQQLDELRAQRVSLQASIERLQAGQQANALRIEKSRLVAPFDGVVSQRYRDVGAVVTEGMPLIQLLESSRLEVLVGVPVRMVNDLEVGGLFDIRVNGMSYPGELLTISQDLNMATRTVLLRFALPDSPVRDGELAVVRLAETLVAEGYWLPAESLVEGMRGLWNIYALSDEVDGLYRIEAMTVQVIHVADDRVYVQGSLAGRKIVQGGLHRVVPGQQVQMAEPVVTR